MHRKFRLLSPRKASSHRAALPSFFLSCVRCFLFSYHRLRPTLLRQTDAGSLTSAKNWVRVAHTKPEGGSGTKKSAQELTQRDKKKCSSFSPPEDRTKTSDLNSDSRPLSFFLFDIKLSCILKLFNPFNKLCNSNNSKLSFDLHSKRGNRT